MKPYDTGRDIDLRERTNTLRREKQQRSASYREVLGGIIHS